MDTPLQRKSKTDTFTRKLKRNIQRTEPPILRMETGTILIVDDNKSVLASLELLLENVFSTVRTAANPNQITTILSTTPIDIVILDMNFSAGINNGNEGLYWLKHIHKIRPSLPVIMLTAYGDVELAVKALKNGATDFLLKPWDNHILIQKIKEAYQNNRPTHHKNSPKSVQKVSGDENLNKSEMLIGHSPAMLQLIKVVTKVAKTDANILITGENGTGKEMLAREIHRLSSRNTRQLLSVDMGAISESLFESELFGHERGAFTDAYESRPGKFEAANGGSLFMDEIGNLPLALQAKLLTVLQNRNITRIGSNKVIPVDIRLISATTKILVNKEELEELLVELRLRIPDEIKQYQKIISNQDAILNEARTQADAMLQEANAQTNELVNEHEIMQRAYANANEVIEQANAQAQAIVDNAVNDANNIRQGAIQYTDDMLRSLQTIINHSMEGAKGRFDAFMSSMQSSYDIVTSNRNELAGGIAAPADEPNTENGQGTQTE